MKLLYVLLVLVLIVLNISLSRSSITICNDVPCNIDNKCNDYKCNANSGDCEYVGPKQCQKSNACAQYSCMPLTGECLELVKDCDDKVACTDDTCDFFSGCVNSRNNSKCANDLCSECTKFGCAEKSCATTNKCLVPKGCNKNNGACEYSKLNCDDGIPCTVDTCNPNSGCVHTADSSQCDDNNACTADTCVEGTGCKHVDRICYSSTNKCLIPTSCNPLTGVCGFNTTECYQYSNACETYACNDRTGICELKNKKYCPPKSKSEETVGIFGFFCRAQKCSMTNGTCVDDPAGRLNIFC